MLKWKIFLLHHRLITSNIFIILFFCAHYTLLPTVPIHCTRFEMGKIAGTRNMISSGYTVHVQSSHTQYLCIFNAMYKSISGSTLKIFSISNSLVPRPCTFAELATCDGFGIVFLFLSLQLLLHFIHWRYIYRRTLWQRKKNSLIRITARHRIASH